MSSSSSTSTSASDPCICRFGVLSTARIGVKNCPAIQTAVNGDMRAISSRDQATADKVAAERQIPVAHGSYEALLADSTLDAIYMPIPSAMHIDWVDKVAASGRHLLCDKPVGINADEVTRILEACRKHNILFMDGVMFMHHPRLAYMHRILNDSSIMGEIRSVHTEFSFPCKLRPIPKNEYAGETGDAKSADDPATASDKPQYGNIRLNPDLEPLGALGDLGYYNIRFTLWAMNYAIPTAVSAHIMYDTPKAGTNKSVPLDISATIFYSNNRMATFVASFTSQFRQSARITGTKGNIHIDDFVLANYEKQVNFTVNQSTGLINGRVDETATKYLINYTRAQEVAMFESFAGQVTSHQHGNKSKTSIFKYGEPHPINNVHAPEINIHQDHHQTLQMINHDDRYTAEQWRDGWESVKLANGHHMSWANITLLTTCVMDACLASNARDGAKVPLKYTPFD